MLKKECVLSSPRCCSAQILFFPGTPPRGQTAFSRRACVYRGRESKQEEAVVHIEPQPDACALWRSPRVHLSSTFMYRQPHTLLLVYFSRFAKEKGWEPCQSQIHWRPTLRSFEEKDTLLCFISDEFLPQGTSTKPERAARVPWQVLPLLLLIPSLPYKKNIQRLTRLHNSSCRSLPS